VPCGRSLLYAGKPFLTSGILRLRGNQDGREIQLIHQLQQDIPGILLSAILLAMAAAAFFIPAAKGEKI